MDISLLYCVGGLASGVGNIGHTYFLGYSWIVVYRRSFASTVGYLRRNYGSPMIFLWSIHGPLKRYGFWSLFQWNYFRNMLSMLSKSCLLKSDVTLLAKHTTGMVWLWSPYGFILNKVNGKDLVLTGHYPRSSLSRPFFSPSQLSVLKRWLPSHKFLLAEVCGSSFAELCLKNAPRKLTDFGGKVD